MKFIDYIKDKIFSIIIYFIFLLLIFIFLISFSVNIFLLFSILFFYMISIFITLIYDYYRRKKFYNYMNKKLEELDQKYLISELIKDCDFIDANIFKDYLYEIDKSYIENLNKYKYSFNEFKEYIELWCHEIKTPITTSKLIMENDKNNKLEDEINLIDYYVEQVLFYARSGNPEKDYLINKINLKNAIDNVIKKNQKSLISKKIKIKTIKEAIFVESDTKWLEFIINQIFVNSIKYSKDNNSKVEIEYKINKNNVILTISDNGIGIPSNEINRVFDKGFTGTNGRSKYNSTGIGLYLCKKLCDKLGHDISIISKENEYTKVTIVFPISSLINNLTKM